MNDKVEINKKLIGKSVRVVTGQDSESWIGLVTDVIDADTFVVTTGGSTVKVDIFDIRSLD